MASVAGTALSTCVRMVSTPGSTVARNRSASLRQERPRPTAVVKEGVLLRRHPAAAAGAELGVALERRPAAGAEPAGFLQPPPARGAEQRAGLGSGAVSRALLGTGDGGRG